LNWIIRLDHRDLPLLTNRLLPEAAQLEQKMATAVPGDHYISLIDPIVHDGRITITDEEGRLLSVDRIHITKFGAIYIGKKALLNSSYGRLLKQYEGM
jgi:hypothetical protein